MVAEHLIGFDARFEPGLCSRYWEPMRRANFLLLAGTPVPLSIDSMVWPSVFLKANSPFPELDEQAFEMPPLDAAISDAGLWGDLTVLKSQLQTQISTTSAPHWIIGVTLLCDASAEVLAHLKMSQGPTQPAVIGPDWLLLGYDVADVSQTSGLSNCSYSPTEAFSIAAQWSRELNDFHLFDDWEKARAFAAMTDARMPSHSPFFAFGLWLIPS
ncbi:hypothetical protein EON80_11235 [bacterium]|nr:MAG: hypothetical protein EON80_11235 [bacterium]